MPGQKKVHTKKILDKKRGKRTEGRNPNHHHLKENGLEQHKIVGVLLKQYVGRGHMNRTIGHGWTEGKKPRPGDRVARDNIEKNGAKENSNSIPLRAEECGMCCAPTYHPY